MNTKKKLRNLACCLLAAATATPLTADEGMWMAGALPQGIAERMQELGCSLKPDDLYNTDGTALKDAVVLFGGFCSGVVVSAEGLVFTNHHCGFDAIQQASSPQHDYVKNGFVARNRGEEWAVPGLYVSFLQRSENVTNRILPLLRTVNADGTMAWVDDRRSGQIADSILSVLQHEVAATDSTLRVDIDAYYERSEFYMNVYRDYTDIRLVFAPPASAGKFGGDTDNWMWPRETCDFSVFRIYAAPDGSPASYSPQNVPYRPRRVAPISLAGYKEGDFSMTLGYPGRTNRYLSSFGIAERMDGNNVPIVNVRGLKQYIWKQAMATDPGIHLKYISKYQNSSNYWKNSIGMNRCLTEQGVIADKKAFEKKVTDWIIKNRKKAYEGIFDRLERGYTSRAAAYKRQTYAREALWKGSDVAAICSRVISWRFKQPDDPQLLTALARDFRDLDVKLDARTLAAMLRAYHQENWADNKLPSFYQTIQTDFNGNYSAYVNHLFAHSVYTDSTRIMNLLQKGRIRTLRNDPMCRFVGELARYMSALQQETARAGAVSDDERLLCMAIREMKNGLPMASDANMTMRLSYGVVGSYIPAPGLPSYPLYTTPQSLAAKAAQAQHNADYAMSADLLGVITDGPYGPYADPASKNLQLCYLTNNDITGGNSGSPVFNGRGELCGLAFDGNWESMANDLQYNPQLTRCICVDIRYVLYLIDRWGKASHLMDELQLVP